MKSRNTTKVQLTDEVILNTDRALKEGWLELNNNEYQAYLAQKIAEQDSKIRSSYFNTITALVYALEAKNKYASGHSQRVANIAAAIAHELGLPPDGVDKIALAGLIHDIGKIGVRDEVLNKPGKLTDEEYQHVISHCEIGERILRPIVEDEEILDMVRHHHEHYDGTGYPDRLSGKQIPLVTEILAVTDAYNQIATHLTEGKRLSQNAAILAVADAYEAIMSERSYRGALTIEEAAEVITQGTGTHFDPAAADALLRINKSLISLFEETENRAKKGAEETRKAKDTQELTRKEAEELTRKETEELTRKEAEELTRKETEELVRKEAEELARKETEELYEGDVQLVVPAPISFEQCKQFKECLEQIENLNILWTRAAEGEDMTIGASVQKPTTLVRVLNELPTVEKVNRKDKRILITLKKTTAVS